MYGVIQNRRNSRRQVKINPTQYYSNNKLLYRCPVCEQMGVMVTIPEQAPNCPSCQVALNWDKSLVVGDRVKAEEGEGIVRKLYHNNNRNEVYGYDVEINGEIYFHDIDNITKLKETE